MLLSVVVPTRNRPNLLKHQLAALDDILSRLIPRDYEIIVGDNSSSDRVSETRDVLRGLPDYFRLRPSSRSLETAEENLARLIPFCSGDYVWFLSDDDGLIVSGVEKMVAEIRKGERDLLIFNSLASRDHGIPGIGPARSGRVRRQFFHQRLDCSLREFLLQTGFFFYITGFSTTVVRRRLLDVAVFDAYLRIGRIYSHVSFLAEVAKDAFFSFINVPLVTFGMVSTDFDGGDIWHSVGVREGGFETSVWTSLWLRQLERLVQKGVFTLEDLRHVCEMNHHQRFYWPHMLAQQVIGQILISDGKVMSEDEGKYVLSWLAKLLPNELFMLSVIEKGMRRCRQLSTTLIGSQTSAFSVEDQKLVQSLRFWQEKVVERDWFQPFYWSTVGAHDIYHDGVGWFAFPVWNRNRRAFLEVCDLPSAPPFFFKADNQDEILEQISTFSVRSAKRLRPPRMWLDDAGGEAIDQTPWLHAFEERLSVGVSQLGNRLHEVGSMLVQQQAQAVVPTVSREADLFSAPLMAPTEVVARYEWGKVIDFSRQDAGVFLRGGFSDAEPWGRWTVGGLAQLALETGTPPADMVLTLMPVMVFDSMIGRAIVVRVNATVQAEVGIVENQAIVIHLPRGVLTSSSLDIELHIPFTKLVTAEPLHDARALGVGFSQLSIASA